MQSSRSLLFLGPEIGEKNDAIEKERKMLKKESGAAPEEHRFYIGDAPFSELVSLLLNASLFSPARFILVKNAELIKNKGDIEALADYFKSPAAPGTAVIFISDSTKIESAVEKFFPKDAKRIFWEMFEENKEKWIFNFFKKENLNIKKDAIISLLSLVENNTLALKDICARIALFTKLKNKENGGASAPEAISEDDIFKLLANAKEENAFALFSAISAADNVRSFDIMHNLLSSGESPQMIFVILTSCFRKFRDYCVLCKNGTAGNDFELRKCGITARGKKDYAAAYRNYGDAAGEFLSLTAKYDILSRANYAMHHIITDMFLCKILSLSKNHS